MSNTILSSNVLIDRVTSAFRRQFDASPSMLVQAPGRVNLIGEHTDYNDGFVLPCAIDAGTLIACRPRADNLVRVVAVDMKDAADTFAIDSPITRRQDAPWANYVRGMVSELVTLGLTTSGADLAIIGNVPQGAGLSSSASLEVAVGQSFKSMYGWEKLTHVELALAAQRAENDFVGCKCGVMDQFISALAIEGHAGMIDCRSLEISQIPMPANTAVLIVHSGVARGLVDSEYNARRSQCEIAAAHFGVSALRDVTDAQIAKERDLDPLSHGRARHVVTENARTTSAARALAAGDLNKMGQLMAQSHQSMRDDFAITTPHIDTLVKILQQAIGSDGGARMTGGGFGGCVVALLPFSAVARARLAIARHYRDPQDRQASIYVCRASAGAGEVRAEG
jgi:galactokinase